MWPLLTGGRCSEVPLCCGKRDVKIVVIVDRWSLFGGGRKLRFDCTLKKELSLVSLFDLGKHVLFSLFQGFRSMYQDDFLALGTRAIFTSHIVIKTYYHKRYCDKTIFFHAIFFSSCELKIFFGG